MAEICPYCGKALNDFQYCTCDGNIKDFWKTVNKTMAIPKELMSEEIEKKSKKNEFMNTGDLMPEEIKSGPEFVNVNWNQVEDYTLSICKEMDRNGYKPEAIVGLLRGGVVPARIISDYFGIILDFFTLDVKLYKGINLRDDVPKIKHFFGDIENKRVLIIDDILDSGMTMNAVLEYFKGKDVKTATLFWKEKNLKKPDYFCKIAKEHEWIIFPWERFEFRRENGTAPN